MFITPKKLSEILAELFPTINLDEFKESSFCKSHRSVSCAWQQVCSLIFPNHGERFFKKHRRKCYDTFRNHFDEINAHFLEIVERKNSLESKNHASNQQNDGSEIQSTYENSCGSALIEVHIPDHARVQTEISLTQSSDAFATAEMTDDLSSFGVDDSKFSIREYSHDGSSLKEFHGETINATDEEYYFNDPCYVPNDDQNYVDETRLIPELFDKRAFSGINFREIDCVKQEVSSTDCGSNIGLNSETSDGSSSFGVNTMRSSTRKSSHNNKNLKKILDGKIVIPLEFWKRFWPKTSDEIRLKRGWCDPFNEYFKKQYPHCVLRIKWHKCLKNSSWNFIAVAECKNSTCTSFRFEASIPGPVPFNDIGVRVYRSREICHRSGEIHRRFISGDARKRLRKDLDGKAPSVLKLKMLGNVKEDALIAGNRNDAPSLMLLQKMSSENNTENDLSKDMDTYMKMLIGKFKISWPGKVCDGYIQGYSVDPFYIILFTETQIHRILSQNKNLFCYLDSTGSIIARPQDTLKQVYYYALVIPGADESSPLAIAEFVSNVHNIPYITLFLSVFNLTVKKITTRRLVFHKIEVDFSLALIQSSLRAFNDMSLKQYLFELDAHIKENDDKPPNFTLVHICSTHLLRTVMRKVKTLFNSKEQRSFAIYLIAKLIHCVNIEDAKKIFQTAVLIFGVNKKCETFDSLLLNLKNTDMPSEIFSAKDSNFLEIDDAESSPKSFQEQSQDTGASDKSPLLRHGSPFYKYFQDACEKTKLEFSTKQFAETNDFYCYEFIFYLMEHIMPFYPVWSAVVLHKYNLLRDSNASVENWFKIVKKDLFAGKLAISPPRFIQIMESFLLARLRDHKYSLKTERQRQNMKKHAELEFAEEFWLKKNRSNAYFRFPKKFDKPNISEPCVVTEINDCTENVNVSSDNERKSSADHTNECTVDTDAHLLSNEVDECITVNREVLDVEENFEIPSIYSYGTDSASLLFSSSLTYPKDFPLNPNNNKVGGILFPEHSLSTLQPNKWLDDNIINGFLILLQNVANDHGTKVLAFESFFVEKLLHGGLSRGFQKWVKATDIFAFDVWLMPVHLGIHWTLLVVVFNHHLFLYLDSMHGPPPVKLIQNMCCFIEANRIARSKRHTRWTDWIVSVPKDIPLQRASANEPLSHGNCGVHVCAWAFTICTETKYAFFERDMNIARKGIARCLLAEHPQRDRAERYKLRQLILESEDEPSNSKPIIKVPFTDKPPMGFSSTLEYCSTLKVLLEAEK